MSRDEIRATKEKIETDVEELYRRAQRVPDPRWRAVRHKILELSIELMGLTNQGA